MEIQLELETESPVTNDTSKESTEGEIPMADASQKESEETLKNEARKADVKLEDIFDDDDSDEEFPNSKPAKLTPQSSLEDAPSSPMYVNVALEFVLLTNSL